MLKKTRSSLVALLLSVMMVLGVASLNIRAKADATATGAFTGGIAPSGNLFEVATISDANYLINKYAPSGTVGGYLATVENGSNVSVNGMANMPIGTDDVSKAWSYAGAKITLDGTTTLDMGVVDLSQSKATDEEPVIGFLPTVNFLGPKAPADSVNPYFGIYYTFRSTVNPEKYFDVAMVQNFESKTPHSSIGVAFNGHNIHLGQGTRNTPGTYYSVEAGDPTGCYAFRFDGSMPTSVSDKASVEQYRYINKSKNPTNSGDYCAIYPAEVYYDYETSKFYVNSVSYTQFDAYVTNDKTGKYHVETEDGDNRFLLLDAATPTHGNGGYGTSGAFAKYNSKIAWNGFTEEEAKSVAVTMHVDWNPAYQGTHDIVITSLAGQQVNTATADTLKANKGTSGLLKEFTADDGILSLSEGYNVMLSDNDVFTKLVEFEVYPEHIGKATAVNNSGLYNLAFELTDGTDKLLINLRDFAEADAEDNIINFRNCYTVSVNGEERWAQNNSTAFNKGEFGYPIPYQFDRYPRYPATVLLDQYGVDTDAGESATAYSSNNIRTDAHATSNATFAIYYNAEDNSLYADVGRWKADYYTNFTRPDGVVVKRWKIADLGSTYDGQRNAFEGFGDKLLSFSMTATLTEGFDSVKVRILEIDGQKLGTDKDGKVAITAGESAKTFAPSDGLVLAGKDVSVPVPFRHNVLAGKVDLDAEDFTAKITTPDGQISDVVDGKFDFVQVGEYKVEYFVDEESIGVTTFTSSASIQGELVALSSFEVKAGLAKGNVLTLADLSLIAEDTLSLEGAEIVLIKDGTVVSTDSAVDSTWTSVVLDRGIYEIVVSTDSFVVSKAFEVKTRIMANAAVENGSVKVNGLDGEAVLLEGGNTIQIIAGEGYELDTFTIGGVDVTADVVNGYYTYDAQDVSDNVGYTATFKKLTYTVTYMVGDDLLDTVENVEYGTLFSAVTAPEIPEKAGYIIQGWSIDGDSAITGDVTAYAVYGLKPYVITFDTVGGTPIDAKEYTEGEVVTAFTETTTKEGYDFDGWYLGEEKFVFGNALTEDITLTAKWTAKKFTVTIVNGLFEDTTIEVEYDKAVDTNSISKDGYTFGGLFTDKECTKKYNGEKITGATTLYASWTKNEEKGGGCMGSVTSSAFLGLFAMVAIVAIKRKNDNK